MSHSKDVGTKFEYDVRDWINSVSNAHGIFAKRIWYSGAGMREPYDIAVRHGEPENSPIVMTIEAKRRIRGKSLAVSPKELTPIGPRHIVVLAVGKYPGRKVPVYVIHGDGMTGRTLSAKPKAKSFGISQRLVGVPGNHYGLDVFGRHDLGLEEFEAYWKRWLGGARWQTQTV